MAEKQDHQEMVEGEPEALDSRQDAAQAYGYRLEGQEIQKYLQLEQNSISIMYYLKDYNILSKKKKKTL